MQDPFRCLMLVAGFLVCREATCQDPWRKAFGAFGQDEASSVKMTATGDIITAGSTGSFGNGSSDAYVLCISGAGDLLWSRTIGGQQVDHAESLAILEDGSLVLAGYTNGTGNGGYDGWLVKMDALANVEWERFYGGSDWDFLHDVKAMSDGGFLLSGTTYSYGAGASDGWLLKTDPEGAVIWDRTFGDVGEDELRAAFVTTDGGAVAAGSQWSPDSGRDVLVSKVDAVGADEWDYLFSTDSLEFATDVIQTIEGGYSIVGTTRAHATFNEHLHLKLDASGDSLWSRHWGQIGAQEAVDHIEVASGELYTVGYTTTSGGGARDFFILRSTAGGDFIFQRTFGGIENDVASSVVATNNGFVLAGRTNSFGAGGDDVMVVRTDSVCGPLFQGFGEVFDPVGVPDGSLRENAWVFPNPASHTTSLRPLQRLMSVALFDPQGRLVRQWSRPVPRDLDLRGLNDGVYQMLTIDEDGAHASQPLIIQAR